jgi:hypothetical protein
MCTVLKLPQIAVHTIDVFINACSSLFVDLVHIVDGVS